MKFSCESRIRLYLNQKCKSDNETVWLEWFGIHPEYKKRHLASLLLEFTMDEAVKRGFKTMKIYASTAENEKIGHHLYKRYGFNQFASSEDGEIIYYKKQLVN